jgi:hypothetical protein
MRKTMLLALMLACCSAQAEEWLSLGKNRQWQQGNVCGCFQHPYRQWNSPGIV